MQTKHFAYVTSTTMPFFHIVTIKIDALVPFVHEGINNLLEKHDIKQLELPLQLCNNSLISEKQLSM